jgi:hypothetical protein
MSRTLRMSRDYRTKTRDSRKMLGCPEGRDCGYCGDNRTHSNVVRANAAVFAIADALDAPVPTTQVTRRYAVFA